MAGREGTAAGPRAIRGSRGAAGADRSGDFGLVAEAEAGFQEAAVGEQAVGVLALEVLGDVVELRIQQIELSLELLVGGLTVGAERLVRRVSGQRKEGVDRPRQ